MKRRDFLHCRSTGGQRIVTLSCQQLFMQFAHSQSLSGDRQTGHAPSEPGRVMEEDAAWWSGEPPLAVTTPSADELFVAIGNELQGADVLVLQEREWLRDTQFADRVKGLLARFRHQGGEVRYWTGKSETAVAP